MEKKTFDEIMEILEEKIGSVSYFAYEEYDKEALGLGEIEEVHKEGGEDQGSHWESVKHFKDHNVYIKVTGYYSSYNGTYFEGWDECTQVTPQERVITVYEE
jgi:hypothetical protein